MHHGWKIPEIQSQILLYLAESQGTLRSLALSCRLLEDPALDKLWKHQTSLLPLVKVMGGTSDLYGWFEDMDIFGEYYGRKLRFRRKLVDQDWTRFGHYASRIKSLIIGDPLEIHKSTFAALCTHRPARTVLTELQQIRIDLEKPDHEEILPYIPAFLGTSVIQAQINFRSGSYDFGLTQRLIHNFLLSLAEGCPKIDSLTVLLDQTAVTPFEVALLKFSSLTKLCWDGLEITPKVLETLASMPSLRRWEAGHLVSVGELLQKPGADTPYRSFTAPYPHLVHLELEPSPCTHMISALKNLQAPLEVLQLREVEDDSPTINDSDYGALFVEISNFGKLRSLYFTALNPSVNEAVVHKAITYLLTLPAIEQLSLRMPYLNEADNSLLLKISKAWPYLESLTLYSTAFTNGPSPRMTLAGLIPLVDGCQRLHTIDVALKYEPFDIDRLPKGFSSAVSTLFCRRSKLNPAHSKEVARCFILLFPELKELHTESFGWNSGSAWNDLRKKWMEYKTARGTNVV